MPEFPFTIVPVVLEEDENQKNYWFYVPSGCEIVQGASVVVLTAKGTASGRASADSHVVEDADECPRCPDQLKPVLWINQPVCFQVELPITKIIIPDRFKQSHPLPYKIQQKYSKFIKDTKSLPPVQLDANYAIVDGYITFLLYRMFGYSKVPCTFLPTTASIRKDVKSDPPEITECQTESEKKKSAAYAVGEAVRVRPDLIPYATGSGYIGGFMKEWLGKTAIIQSVHKSYIEGFTYILRDDPCLLHWTETDLEPVEHKS